MRSQVLQDFLDAAQRALEDKARKPPAARVQAQSFAKLKTVGVPRNTAAGARLPVCQYLSQFRHLEAFSDPILRDLMQAFFRLEPQLHWCQREGAWTGASDNFASGHANALVLGPKGYEVRADVWLGVSLVAPNVRYPNHNHPPEEVYLVMSQGDFWQEDGDWFTPGVGGSLYNRPHIWHAMRSGETPLLAFWLLNVDSRNAH